MMRRYSNDHVRICAEISIERNELIYAYIESTIFIINTYWVRYGLALLFSSRSRLVSQKGRDNFTEAENSKEPAQHSTGLVMFECSEKEYEDFMYITENDCVKNYNETKVIFLRILQLLNKLKANTAVFVKAVMRVEVAQYTSKAYKYFAFYEQDKVKQVKLQKRRIEVMEDCLKTLQAEDDKIVRCFVWLELAIVNSTVLGIKIEDLDESKLTAKELAAINQLAKTSMNYFQLYMENCGTVNYALASRMVDDSYQVVSSIKIKP